MGRVGKWLVAAIVMSALAGTQAAAAPEGRSGGSDETQRYIVVLRDRARAKLVADEHSAEHGAEVSHVYRAALRGYAAEMSERAVARVREDPRVRWVEVDRPFRLAAQTVPTGINRIDAEISPTAKIDGLDERVDVDVAVIDTGVHLSHPDLNVVKSKSKNCSLLALSANDDHGHGSHVAGTIGAKDNDLGVVGVAPGARIWAVKVLNFLGTGFTSEIVCGINYVTAKSRWIEVANMSLGGLGSDDGNCGNTNGDAMHKSICNSVEAGVTYAVAAGNDHANAAGSVPASYDEVITVSALADFNGLPGGDAASTCRSDVDDTFADFSNFGPDVDLIAPGVCILSTWLNGGYNTISGTSMASPHVAGAAALYKAGNPEAGPEAVKTALQNIGNLNWTWPSEDGDAIQEELVNVAGI